MVKFSVEEVRGDFFPVLNITERDLDDPRRLQRDIIGFLTVLRTCGALYKRTGLIHESRTRRVRRELEMRDVKQYIIDFLRIWNVGGPTRARYEDDFARTAFRNMMSIEEEEQLERERPARVRSMKFDDRGGGIYCIQVAGPTRRSERKVWHDMAFIRFFNGEVGEEIMSALKDSHFSFAKLHDIKARKTMRQEFEEELKQLGGDKQDDDDDDDDDGPLSPPGGDGIQQMGDEDQDEDQDEDPETLLRKLIQEMHECRINHGLRNLTADEYRVYEGCGGLINNINPPTAGHHDIIYMMYSMVPLFEYVSRHWDPVVYTVGNDVDGTPITRLRHNHIREIDAKEVNEFFQFFSICIPCASPKLFVEYQRNINIPILLFMSLLNEEMAQDATYSYTLNYYFQSMVKELWDSEYENRTRFSLLLYRMLGFVTGYYGVMTSKGIFANPLNMKQRKVLSDKLDINLILKALDQYADKGHMLETDWDQAPLKGDPNRENADLGEAGVDEGITVRYKKLPRLKRNVPYTRSLNIRFHLPMFNSSIEELLRSSIGVMKDIEDVPFGAYLSKDLLYEVPDFSELDLSDLDDSDKLGLGTWISRCSPEMLYFYVRAVRAGAVYALMKLEDLGFIQNTETNLFHCVMHRPALAGGHKPLYIDITCSTKVLDDQTPGQVRGNRGKCKKFFDDMLLGWDVEPSSKFAARCITFVTGEDKYGGDIMSYMGTIPGDYFTNNLSIENRKFSGKVYYHTRGRLKNQVINGWDPSNLWFSMTTRPSLLSKYGQSFDNMVFFKESGCFYRSILCTCRPEGGVRKAGRVTFCSCLNEFSFEPVTVEQIPDIMQKQFQDKPVMVVAFLIESMHEGFNDELTREYGQQIRVLYQSKDFYKTDENIVVLTSLPTWEGGVGHCAVWKNYCTGEDREGIKRFRFMKRFNLFLRTYLKNPMEVCPICGEMYTFGLDNQHYIMHTKDVQCEVCGFGFDTLEEYECHKTFHCKHPRYDAKLELSDEEVVYKDKGMIEDTTRIIYADLESAIDDEGRHNNILAGWVVWNGDDNKKVHIVDSVEEMILEWLKIEAACLIIYFHNGKGYDFHFIVETCTRLGRDVSDFEIIADSCEKISYFDVKFKNRKVLKFRDTFAFVTTSLEKWTDSSVASGAPFECYNRNFSYDIEKRDDLRKKNPFPYAAIKSAADLDRDFTVMYEWAEAPNAVDLFCGKFTKEQILEFRTHWHDVRLRYNWITVKDYYKDYLICDVAQLADNMEFFCEQVKSEFGVDPHQYFGTPSLTWAIWLKSIAGKFHLDPITDADIFDVVNSSIRGGQTGAMTRLYDVEEEEDTFVCDLDCNSLYPTVMIKFSFPCTDWKKEDLSTLTDFSSVLPRLESLHESGRSGFIELDMIVKDKEEFYSYVPVASKRTIKGVYEVQSMVEYCADYDQDVAAIYFSGLTQVMGPHDHYCCHTRMLEWYLKHDVVEITNLHRLVHAIDAPVFKEYVERNLEKRAEAGRAHDPIKKMLYKLMNNSLYGKTYEDVTKRSVFRLVTTAEFDKMDKSILHREVRDMNCGWKLIECKALTCQINKPFYLGAAITEFSKLWMYIFFYDKIRPKFPQTEVLYTDTDALTICFRGYGINSLRELADRLNTEEEQIIDTSNFRVIPTERRHTQHNEEAGLFKSETGESRILKMVALRAKTYIMLCQNGEIKMSVKGCPMDQKKNLTYEMFRSILMGGGVPYSISFSAIRSEGHQVFNRQLDRIVLSADDRKRFIFPDHIHTAPLFSKPHLAALGKVGIPSGIEFP